VRAHRRGTLLKLRTNGAKPKGRGLETASFTEGNVPARRAIFRLFKRKIKYGSAQDLKITEK
jgi:hypothetical protein